MNFANRAKFDIIMLLREKPANVKGICKRLHMEQSAVSHNLKRLHACNILSIEKEGREHLYSLNKETVIPMLKLVDAHVRKNCGGKCRIC